MEMHEQEMIWFGTIGIITIIFLLVMFSRLRSIHNGGADGE